LQKKISNPNSLNLKIISFFFTLICFTQKNFSVSSILLKKKKFFENLKVVFFDSFSKTFFAIFILIFKKTFKNNLFLFNFNLIYYFSSDILIKNFEQEIQYMNIIFQFLINIRKKFSMNFNFIFYISKLKCMVTKLSEKIIFLIFLKKNYFNFIKIKIIKNFKENFFFLKNRFFILYFLKKLYNLNKINIMNKILTKNLIKNFIFSTKKENKKHTMENYLLLFFLKKYFFFFMLKFFFSFFADFIKCTKLLKNYYFPYLKKNYFLSLDPFWGYYILKINFLDNINLIFEKNCKNIGKLLLNKKIFKKKKFKLEKIKEKKKNKILKKLKKKSKNFFFFKIFKENSLKLTKILFKNKNLIKIFPKN
jgi:hypothetical protein